MKGANMNHEEELLKKREEIADGLLQEYANLVEENEMLLRACKEVLSIAWDWFPDELDEESKDSLEERMKKAQLVIDKAEGKVRLSFEQSTKQRS